MKISSRVTPLRSSVFSVLAKRLAGYTGKRYPLHIGNNSLAPPDDARWTDVDYPRFGDPYAYGHPSGEAALRDALAEKLRRVNQLSWATGDHVQVSTGSTHAITCTMQALLDPGDEVLLLAPYWPLARGIAYCAAVKPVDVPFYQQLLDDPGADPAELVEPWITDRTRAIYIISPNNPNGIVLSRAQLESLAELARQRDLWVISDEAYEAYAYARAHISIASLDGMAERTVSAYTFSKTYAMAGARVGYAVGPPEAIEPMRKVATHSVYNTSQVCQSAALAALGAGESYLDPARERYRSYARLVDEQLQATFHPAQGGSFVFVDLRAYGPDALPVLERAADRGVTLAPGAIFGAGYQGFARLCYTAVDPASLEEGIAILNEVLQA